MSRVSVVILTYNRPDELRRTLKQTVALPEQPAIVLVDNASPTEAAAELASGYPQVGFVRMPANVGAAGRNAGVERTTTPYVAFSDDDTEWEPGALARATEILDAHPRIGAIAGRVLVGPERRLDPVAALMATSPLPSEGLPGPAVLGFLACCIVFRRAAFLEAGGFEQRFFIGGEETLLALDLAAHGWTIVYHESVTAWHFPSPSRDPAHRRRVLARNALWVTWLRRPATVALRQTARILRDSAWDRASLAGCFDALRGFGWVARGRKVLPPEVEARFAMLERA